MDRVVCDLTLMRLLLVFSVGGGEDTPHHQHPLSHITCSHRFRFRPWVWKIDRKDRIYHHYHHHLITTLFDIYLHSVALEMVRCIGVYGKTVRKWNNGKQARKNNDWKKIETQANKMLCINNNNWFLSLATTIHDRKLICENTLWQKHSTFNVQQQPQPQPQPYQQQQQHY